MGWTVPRPATNLHSFCPRRVTTPGRDIERKHGDQQTVVWGLLPTYYLRNVQKARRTNPRLFLFSLNCTRGSRISAQSSATDVFANHHLGTARQSAADAAVCLAWCTRRGAGLSDDGPLWPRILRGRGSTFSESAGRWSRSCPPVEQPLPPSSHATRSPASL